MYNPVLETLEPPGRQNTVLRGWTLLSVPGNRLVPEIPVERGTNPGKPHKAEMGGEK